MPVQFDTYQPSKLESLRKHLELCAEKNEAKPYEIFVDSIKAVGRTTNVEEFDNYENYLSSDNNNIKVIIYYKANSPRNECYHFSLHARNSKEALEEGLSSLPPKQLNKKMMEKMVEERQTQAFENEMIKKLNQKIEELNQLNNTMLTKLEEKDKEITRLYNALEIAEANRNTFRGMDMGKLLATAGETFIRNNTAMLKKVPGLGGIAEFIDKDTVDKYGQKQPESNATTNASESESLFKKRASEGEVKNEEQDEVVKNFQRFFQHLQQHFSAEEMDKALEILDLLSMHKEKIPITLDLLSEKKQN